MTAEQLPHQSPGDHSIVFPVVPPGDVAAAVAFASAAARDWARTPLDDRIAMLRAVQTRLAASRDALARGISLEVGKPITESLGEVAALLGKIDLTVADGERYLRESRVVDGPHPAMVRTYGLGPAAVIAPFNFPLHLGHGATVAHLLSGNPVIFKPSPLAAHVAGQYATILQSALPRGVFTLLQGGGAIGNALCMHPGVRAVCFTGSAAVGRNLAKALAEDFSKELALELGGSNVAIVCADADLDRAAEAIAEGACLTAGQRCNATSRVIVEAAVAAEFQKRFIRAIEAWEPGDPMKLDTRLGPLISTGAVQRYEHLCQSLPGAWIVRGGVIAEVNGKRGNFVKPAVVLSGSDASVDAECFVPIVSLKIARGPAEAVQLANSTPYGMTASVFTSSPATFERMGEELEVGNLYANLPTTFSPSTLPFGGWRDSGNRRPGGRGFARFTAREQAVQWAEWRSAR